MSPCRFGSYCLQYLVCGILDIHAKINHGICIQYWFLHRTSRPCRFCYLCIAPFHHHLELVQPHYGHFAEVICFDRFWYDSNGFLRHVVTTIDRHANTSYCDVTEWVDVFELNEVIS